jgi:hypothetical protein
MGLNCMIVLSRIAMRGCGSLGSCSECSLVFFGLAALNLRVDSCMFETGFLMLAGGSRSESSLLFFLEQLCVRGCFSLVSRISAWNICASKNEGLPYCFLCCCDPCALLVCVHSVCVAQCLVVFDLRLKL